MSYFVLGSTGLVGNQILKYIESVDAVTAITTLTRRQPKIASPKVNAIVEEDSSLWPKVISQQAQGTKVFFSAFGTTRAAAGSAENFRKIDYGINYDAAKAAKDLGVETFVLISTAGAKTSSPFLYPATKGKLEDDIIALKFPRTIILRPGVLLGDRDVPKGFLNDLAVRVGSWTKGTSLDFVGHGVDAADLARVSFDAAQEDFDKSAPVVKYLYGGDITKLVRQLK
ncbi:protein FMP52-1, mitochondrial [Suhomyces tanzawaensis NRRL Y-17324]|uniref:Protein FMP52-1, mitochondrial n=1 Tax=Suhomyces tanzawaensis NRRL Y-17324 TaxID=984487 RepID=A0A1E4SQP0_9ASCO|nr:protein FMP52-1, mitochondrial [Suhomyces tanzawaensis NRRL Y-17324]ODV81808.1 protein FMP52-1, mitochondrial [Suhomyces tanzawaensis NRRL Y-17324]